MYRNLLLNIIKQTRFLRVACLLVSAGMLAVACASSTAKFTEQQFSTHIFANDNKQFSLQLAPSAKSQPQANARKQPRGPATDVNGMPVRPKKSSGASPQKLERFALTQLEPILEESGYCRKGYLIIRRTLKPQLIQLVGECQELATASDRQQYPNTRSNIIRESTFPNFERIDPSQVTE